MRVIHQENGGHGEGVNQGIRNAQGLYFKVVDSDDWLDDEALSQVMDHLRAFAAMEKPVDLLLCNYVYEHVSDNTRHVISYKGILPEGRVFGWEDCGKFPPSQNILMHSVIYRTQVLRDCGIELPKHTFYVDNIFVYQPLRPLPTRCTISIWIFTATTLAARTRASTSRSWSSGSTSRCGSPRS